MSRCFPFPPPGYEKKITITDSNLLKKEKHREKKHKKEKKDREKNDDKEKKEKDRNDEKSKQKKDKKEKNRDKKKEKMAKDRQIDNLSLFGLAGHKVPPEGDVGQIFNKKNLDTGILFDDSVRNAAAYNGENLGHYTSLASKPNGVKLVHDFDKRIRDGTKTVGSQMGERITLMHHKRNEGGERLYPNRYLANNFEDSDLALELDRRLKNEAEQPYHQNQTGNKIICEPQKREGGVTKSVTLDTMERGDNRIKGASGKYDRTKAAGITMVPGVSTPAQTNHDRMPRPTMGNNTVIEIEGQERIRHQEHELQKQGKKRKDKDRNGQNQSHGIDKSREKEIKEVKGNNQIGQNRAEVTRGSHEMDTLCTPDHEFHTEKHENNNMPKKEELNQPGEILKNGIYQVNGLSKLSRPSSIHLPSDGRRALEPCQIPVKPSLDGRGAANIIKVGKVGKVNGVIEAVLQCPATEHISQARAPSPHPDAKRLIEILSVPKIDELSELNDSDWLFSGKGRPGKKPRVDDSHAGTSVDMPQVWSKAASIESADVYALPYVIPY
ncbi:unnamed protein product [Rhodiola kirilowii]